MSDTPDNPVLKDTNHAHAWVQSSNRGGAANRLNLAPGLYVVSTPIGNLRDITLRGLDVLSNADLILAEDTRQTRKLLSAYDINTPLSAYHDHNAAKRVPALLERLQAGETLALVSDAGTPLVSDPGFKLAHAAIDADINVIPVPGASAVLAGLVASGLPSDSFTFAGFLPSKSAARKTALERYKTTPGTLIFFESGGRLEGSLTDMQTVLGERQAVIARELTKRYEETRKGPIDLLIKGLTDDPARGEIVVLLAPSEKADTWSENNVDAALTDCMEDMGLKRASSHIAELSGWPKRNVYQRALNLKNTSA